jgi:hypothetical protein
MPPGIECATCAGDMGRDDSPDGEVARMLGCEIQVCGILGWGCACAGGRGMEAN